MAGAGVGNGDDAGLRRQGLQPVGEAILRMLPVFGRRLETLIDHAAIFLSGDQLAKRVFALGGPALTAGSGQAVKGEAVDAFFFEVQKGALDQRGIVGGDIVNRRIAFRPVEGAANADNRHIDVDQQIFNFRIVIISNDAVA